MIPDPLELVADLVERQQEAQVAGHRRLGRDRHRHGIVDDPLRTVDEGIARHDLAGHLGVALDERPDRQPDLALDERAHPQDAVLDLALVAIERTPRADLRLRHPNRPET